MSYFWWGSPSYANTVPPSSVFRENWANFHAWAETHAPGIPMMVT